MTCPGVSSRPSHRSSRKNCVSSCIQCARVTEIPFFLKLHKAEIKVARLFLLAPEAEDDGGEDGVLRRGDLARGKVDAEKLLGKDGAVRLALPAPIELALLRELE